VRSRYRVPPVVSVLALLLPAVVRAQDSVIVIDPDAPVSDSTQRGALPPAILTELLEVYNDSLTIRLPGGLVIPRGTSMGGKIAAFRGTVRVQGEIDGSLTVINGDLLIDSGGVVTGDVLVAGGGMTIAPGGVHDGESRIYWDAAPVFRETDGTLAPRERRRPIGELATAQRTFGIGKVRTTLTLTTGQTYNRIEGLPLVFGPAFDYRPSRTVFMRLDARGILRTAGNESPFRSDFGYSVRGDIRFHAPRGFGIGGRLYSEIRGIEEHTLPKDEIGWAAFLLQRDNRDYFDAKGIVGSFYVFPARQLRLEASVRYDHQGSVRATDPWSLFRNEDQWRPNPLIDDGHYTTFGLGAEVDTRDSKDASTEGWWLRAGIEHSSSNDVAPATVPSQVRDPIPTTGYDFDRLTLDLRRYNRLSAADRLNFRLWAGGWIGGDPLPVQRRLSLGGLDLVPGYAFRASTCAPVGFNDPANAALCDRAIFTQGEFRHRLPLRVGYTYRDQEHKELDRFFGIDEVYLVVLGDAGMAWLTGEGPGRVPNNRIPNLDEWKADLGVGFDAGWIGAYIAKAVTDGEPVRFFVRLARRF
jgi:hypothetical protein